MQKLNSTKGFTLIELLVVIAIIGILAAVVLIAINPAERIREARDSGAKSDVTAVSNAVESCYTQLAQNNYAQCNTSAQLTGGSWMKTFPDNVTIAPGTGTTVNNVVIYKQLEASSHVCDNGTGTPKYMVYHSATGVTRVECGTTPTP